MEFLALLFVVILALGKTSCDYWSDRSEMISRENSAAVGSSIVLNETETNVNAQLMNAKLKEYDEGFADPSKFPPSIHFFHSKAMIENSEVFQFIQKLPKGASLHSHDFALVSFDYLYNLTYKDNLYACLSDADGSTLKLYFFENQNTDATCDWRPISEWRKNYPDFDERLTAQLTLVTEKPEDVYPDINTVWSKLDDKFTTVEPLLRYKPVFEEYFYHALQELYDDNVMYLEYRSYLPTVYDGSGKTYDSIEVTGLYVDTLNRFKADHPDFHGARLIYAPSRRVDNSTVKSYVNIMMDLIVAYPDFIAGFDLVGQEDMGEPLAEFIPNLLTLSGKVKFFFHAGESNWNGGLTDLNLIDAILLNTTRIGHGYALLKHPEVLKIAKEKQIAIEINPISNQVLKLVDDLRDHNGAFLIASGYPVVVSCDDPSYWGAKALSYDWYMAFMGMTSRSTDLKFLKQLALNSIKYSAMDDAEKQIAKSNWEQKWKAFIDLYSKV